jgi:hypothetical protein
VHCSVDINIDIFDTFMSVRLKKVLLKPGLIKERSFTNDILLTSLAYICRYSWVLQRTFGSERYVFHGDTIPKGGTGPSDSTHLGTIIIHTQNIYGTTVWGVCPKPSSNGITHMNSK